MSEPETQVRIKGARVGNLKNLSLSLPLGRLHAVTGASGSGKSSLVFGVLLAESQRRFLSRFQALDASSQAVPLGFPPDVDEILGLPIVLGMGEPPSLPKLETLATASGLYALISQLYVHLGQAHCPACDAVVSERSKQSFLHSITHLSSIRQLSVLAPLGNFEREELEALRERFLEQGYSHVMISGQRVCWDEEYYSEELDELEFPAEVSLAVDAMKFRESNFSRLGEATELALELSAGLVEVHLRDEDGQTHVEKYQETEACLSCGELQKRISAADYLFYKAQSACGQCQGFGNLLVLEVEALWREDADTLITDAILPWEEKSLRPSKKVRESIFSRIGVNPQSRASSLSQEQRRALLFGAGTAGLRDELTEEQEGSVVGELVKKYQQTKSEAIRLAIGRYAKEEVCGACHGARVQKQAACRRLANLPFAELFTGTITEALHWLTEVKNSPEYLAQRSRAEQSSAARVLLQAFGRVEQILSELSELGVSYVTLDRALRSLSSGELQRVFLARELAGAMQGLLYAFDEPSAGLHAQDRVRVARALKRLKDKGSTVLMVEHQADLIADADYRIHLGPGAGSRGGELLFSGPASEFPATLSKLEKRSELPKVGSEKKNGGASQGVLRLQGASLHNLKSLDVTFPLGQLGVVTGVSGSGKSSLLSATLVPAVTWALAHSSHQTSLDFSRFSLRGLEGVEKLKAIVDASEMRASSGYRSVIATVLDIYTPLRELFSQSTPARMRGFEAKHFSFNTKAGQCERCKGRGVELRPLRGMQSEEIICRECSGTRYRAEVQSITWRGKSITEVLALEVSAAREFFKNIPALREPLAFAEKFGLGYLPLIQAAPSLSRGEFQRLSLAAKLGGAHFKIREQQGACLFVFDEPTRGLSQREVRFVISLLRELCSDGNSVILVEHNEEVIAASDYQRELGPGAGSDGGRLL